MGDRDSENRKCFLCENGEAGEKLTSVAYKGKKSLEKFCTDSGLTELSEKLVTEWNNGNGSLSCHKSCKLDLFNSARTGQQKRKDRTRDRDVLVSFTTGFYSKRGDEINSENALEVGKVIQTKLDNQVPSTPIDTKNKVKPLSCLRNSQNAEATTRINALKYFNRLVIFAQRESNLEKSLAFELTPLPLSLFSEKDQLMLEPNKAAFAQT